MYIAYLHCISTLYNIRNSLGSIQSHYRKPLTINLICITHLPKISCSNIMENWQFTKYVKDSIWNDILISTLYTYKKCIYEKNKLKGS